MSVEAFNTAQTVVSGEYDFEITITNTGSQDWFDISSVKSASVDVSGLESGGTIAIHLSNAKSQPAAATDGNLDQTAFSANGRFLLAKLPARWAKIKKAEGGVPTETTVLFHGITR